MSKFVEFPLEEGGSILIEASDENKGGSGFARGETPKEVADKAVQSLDASFENIRKSADLLVNKLRGLTATPDEMEINFSLKASGELGNLVVGKAGAEANYTVTLRWRKEEKKDDEKKDEGKKEEMKEEM